MCSDKALLGVDRRMNPWAGTSLMQLTGYLACRLAGSRDPAKLLPSACGQVQQAVKVLVMLRLGLLSK